MARFALWPQTQILATQRMRTKVEQCMKDARVSSIEMRRLRAMKESLNRQELLWKQGIDPKTTQSHSLNLEENHDETKATDHEDERDGAGGVRVSVGDEEDQRDAVEATRPQPPAAELAALGQLNSEHSAFLPFMALNTPSPTQRVDPVPPYGASRGRTVSPFTFNHQHPHHDLPPLGPMHMAAVTPTSASGPAYFQSPVPHRPFLPPQQAMQPMPSFGTQLPEFWAPYPMYIFHPGAPPSGPLQSLPPLPAPLPFSVPPPPPHILQALRQQALNDAKQTKMYFIDPTASGTPPHFRR